MNGSMLWWAWLLPTVRPLATFFLMLALGFVQRQTAGKWPTMAEWHTASSGLPSLWTVAMRAVAVLRDRRPSS